MHPVRMVLALLSVAVLAGCGGTSEPGPAWPPDLLGSWEWVRSADRVTGEPRTPDSEGYGATLVLARDPGNAAEGTFDYRRDGVTDVAGRFTLAYEDEPGNDFVVWDPAFVFHHEVQWVTLGADTLRLVDATTDGYESTWAR